MIALVNARRLRSATPCSGPKVEFPPIPSFAPEHFAVARAGIPAATSSSRRGIEQLDSEGVVQVLVSDVRGEQAPVLAAVGPLQFDVVTHRMEHEFGGAGGVDHLDPQASRRRTDAASQPPYCTGCPGPRC